ncbi:AAA family ATPase [Bosea sp. (in: a-proteobacteria)]|uniref:AAA family ATPase n=1 Tax=Bosea sp. (in: a-proteobacteria) TaxID=1871050 RepID=UPI003F7103EE
MNSVTETADIDDDELPIDWGALLADDLPETDDPNLARVYELVRQANADRAEAADLRRIAERDLRRAERLTAGAAPPKADNDNDPAGPKGAPLPVICPTDWHGLPVPQREWFIEGLIPTRQVTMLAGDGGVGKSLLGVQIAAAACLGIETLGLAPARCGVVYLGAEDEADEFHRRLADIVAAHGRTLADLVDFRLIPLADRDALLATPDPKGVMQPTSNFVSLDNHIARHRPGLVILDTSADLFGGDEIKRGQVRQFVAMLRGIAIKWKCAVVLLSHPSLSGMQTGAGTSGSTAWNNSVRSRIYLTRPDGKDVDPDIRVLKTMKANYGAVGDEMKLRWRAGAFVLDDGLPAAEIAFVNRAQDDAFVRLLRAVTRSGQVVAPTKGVNFAPKVLAARPDAAPYDERALEKAMHRLLADSTLKVVRHGPPSKRRQQLLVSADDFGGED